MSSGAAVLGMTAYSLSLFWCVCMCAHIYSLSHIAMILWESISEYRSTIEISNDIMASEFLQKCSLGLNQQKARLIVC